MVRAQERKVELPLNMTWYLRVIGIFNSLFLPFVFDIYRLPTGECFALSLLGFC